MQYVVHVMETTQLVRKGEFSPEDHEQEQRTFKVGAIETTEADKAKAFATVNRFGPYSTTILCRIYTGGRSVLLTEGDMEAVAQEYHQHFDKD